MRLIQTHLIHADEPTVSSPVWQTVREQLETAIKAVVWPADSHIFTINSTMQVKVDKKGRKTKKGINGVTPIKEAFAKTLETDYGWKTERSVIRYKGRKSRVDAFISTELGNFAVEWETGNISSSHRSLNRLALAIMEGTLIGGILVLPSRKLYKFLTDRIGNYQEVEPFFTLYEALPLKGCVLAVMEIEHDAEDASVPAITKGTDGWALVARDRDAKTQQQLLFDNPE